MFLIDENGEAHGEVDTAAALAMAVERELDLVEVSPNAKPPVAKILSWSKLKYQINKKKKEGRAKKVEQKEMWFKVFIDKGDLGHKLKKVREFLAKKHSVKLTIKAKGRVTRDHLSNLMKEILTDLAPDIVPVDESPKMQGRNMSLIVRPAPKTKVAIVNPTNENEKQNQNT